MEHNIFCAILACAEGFLSNGLQDLINERAAALGKEAFSSEQICRLCSGLVLAQSNVILKSLDNLLIRNKCEKKVSVTVSNCTHVNGTLATGRIDDLSFCSVWTGDHGRMLCATQGVPRGHRLLQESPFAVAKSNSCGCKEGPIVVEHIALGCSIRHSREVNRIQFSRFMNKFNSGLLEHSQGRSGDTTEEGVNTGGPVTGRNEDGVVWPLQVQLLVAVISSIICLHEASYESYTAGKVKRASHTTECAEQPTLLWQCGISKEQLSSEAWVLMQILCRLPQNTHAISSVVSNNTSSTSYTSFSGDKEGASGFNSEIQQVRVGYAVFLTASSVNHSCRPNASIRFAKHPSSSAAYCCHDNGVMNYLRNVMIEIVSTVSIPGYKPSSTDGVTVGGASSGAASTTATSTTYHVVGEITISYGPLHGPHSVEMRQKVLQSQYLFTCTCSSCVSDLIALIQHKTAARDARNLHNSKKIEEIINLKNVNERLDGMQTASLGMVAAATSSAADHAQLLYRHEADTVYLHSSIKSVKSQLLLLNTLFTDVLHQAHKQHPPGEQYDWLLLNSFENKKLFPLRTELFKLQKTYYPLSESCISRLAPQFDRIHSEVIVRSDYAHDPLFTDFISAYCNYYDMHGHMLALRNDFPSAALLVHTSILSMLYGGIYELSDVVIGRERVKLSGLLLSVGNVQACTVQVKCALDVLIPVVSGDDPDVTEAKHLYAFCLRNK